MCFKRVLTTIRKAEYAELIALYLIQGAAAAMWLVPLTTVLSAHGLGMLRPYAYAATGLAAFISPLIFGAMADRHASPVKVLRGLAFATAIMIAVVSAAIGAGLNRWLVLGLIQVYSLCASPLGSISATVILARIANAQKEFGPIRGMYTLGWIIGCLVVSALNADQSTRSGYAGAVTWLIVAGFTFFLPPLETPRAVAQLTLRQRLGWDALALLKNPDHRVVYLTVALNAIPLAAFYPYTPPHMRELGLQHTSAWMSLGQVTELICMFTLGAALARWRLKWIFVAGLGFSVLRFVLCALNSQFWLLAGVFLHGASCTLVMSTAQIYIDQRVDASWRARAQALMTVVYTGAGNMFGYLSAGAWFAVCTGPMGTRWTMFWSGLAAACVGVLVYFLAVYQGRTRESFQKG
ncbi:MAG TPA: MFS transporter [Verrucomicrobiae bacterium]|nr:MFS transporter [Verrucomicrobiae bacterium]